MTPAHVLQITTPKGVVLNSLWFGPTKPSKVIILIHGLTGSVFSQHSLVASLIHSSTAVITFNNRGFEQVVSVVQKVGKKSRYLTVGGTHEKFIECADDIEGVVTFAKEQGVKSVFLAGHSTGCQKAVYWAAKNGEGVDGIILLGPLSDYAGLLAEKGERVLKSGVSYARKLVAAGRPRELMPVRYREEWFLCDAQRYISLYTPDSPEEIFSYAQPLRVPQTMLAAGVPLLVLLAGKDEYADRPAKSIAEWFESHLSNQNRVMIIPAVGHSFKGGETEVTSAIKKFTSKK